MWQEQHPATIIGGRCPSCMRWSSHSPLQASAGVARHSPAGQGSGAARQGVNLCEMQGGGRGVAITTKAGWLQHASRRLGAVTQLLLTDAIIASRRAELARWAGFRSCRAWSKFQGGHRRCIHTSGCDRCGRSSIQQPSLAVGAPAACGGPATHRCKHQQAWPGTRQQGRGLALQGGE